MFSFLKPSSLAKKEHMAQRYLKSQKGFSLGFHLGIMLTLVQAVNISLLVIELSGWMMALITLCLAWRFYIVWHKQKLPNKFVLVLIALAGSVMLAIAAKQLGLLLTMLHLLCFSYGLKTLEIKSRKDFYQLILLGLFILASSFIFRQNLAYSLLASVVLIFNLSLLVRYFAPNLTLKNVATLTGKLLLQSIPFAILLFIVFPRLSPFWQVPHANSAKTGLSETVTPGDIANLALSHDLAFRVEFEGTAPAKSQLYWRAMVLEHYDGNSWQRHRNNKLYSKAIFDNALQFELTYPSNDSSVDYQVIAEPSYQHWLFSLDVPQVHGQQQVLLPDFSIRAKKPLTNSFSYQVKSYPDMVKNLTLSSELKNRNLYYPKGENPRLEQYAEQLVNSGWTEQQIIQTVLTNIRQNNYFYTLSPPLLNDNSLDQFFFDTHSGFCVHYASAFAYLMRAAGIPARVVTGYLGGELNPQGNYYSVFQYDAHAWTEVWLPQQGWLRVDPTSAVNPQRVEDGFSAAMMQQQTALSSNFFSLHQYRNFAWVNQIRMQLEAIDYQWTRWVVGFSAQKQYDLLSKWFGHISLVKTGVMMTLGFVTILALLWLANRYWRSTVKTPEQVKIYLAGLKHIEQLYQSKPKSMPANSYAQMIQQQFGDDFSVFVKFSNLFTTIEYQHMPEKTKRYLIGQLKQQLKLVKALS